MIDPRLKTFITLIEQHSTVACANVLHITQPAVTQQIHSLEKEYDVKLFTKIGRNLTPSDKAIGLYHKVKQLSILENEIIDSIKSDKKKPISFAVTRSIAESILPEIIMKLTSKLPDHHLNVKVQNTSDILQSLKEGQIIFAIIEGNVDHNLYTCKPVLSTHFFGICKKNGLYSKINQIEDIYKVPLFIREKGSGSREILESILKAHDLTIDNFKIYHEIENIPTIVKLIENDLGITFVYENVVKKQIDSGIFQTVLINHFKISRKFNFVYFSSSSLINDADNIYQTIKEIDF